MDTLSWVVYLASVINGVGAILFVGPWVVLAIISVYVGISRDNARWDINHGDGDGETARIAREALKGHLSFEYIKWAVPLAAVISFVGILMPNKDTVYAIAASEFGEAVITESGKPLIDYKEYELE